MWPLKSTKSEASASRRKRIGVVSLLTGGSALAQGAGYEPEGVAPLGERKLGVTDPALSQVSAKSDSAGGDRPLPSLPSTLGSQALRGLFCRRRRLGG